MTIVNLALINQHFEFLYSSAQKVANEKAIQSMDNLKLSCTDPDQWAFMLRKHIRQSEWEINHFTGNEYVRFAFDKGFLNKIYAARMLFFEINDEGKLREAFILTERLTLLNEHYKCVMAERAGVLVFYDLCALNDDTEPTHRDMEQDTFRELPKRRDLPEIKHLMASYRMTDLIGCMVPERGLINQLYETNARIATWLNNDEKASFCIREEIKSAYREIYIRAFADLKHLTECVSKDGMAVFILNQITDIKYMEEMAKLEGSVLHAHFKHLKHFFKQQMHCIECARNFKQPQVPGSDPKKKTRKQKTLTFDYGPGPRPLKPILVAMQLKMNIFGGNTTVDDFMEVLMCKDLNKYPKKIQVNSKNNLFYGLIKKLKPWCPSLRPSSIEQSGVFIHLNEGTITAACFYNASPMLWEDSQQMDAIFNAKYP